MKIQPTNYNNYTTNKNKNSQKQSFKKNIVGIIEVPCDQLLCAKGEKAIQDLFINTALEKGLIKTNDKINIFSLQSTRGLKDNGGLAQDVYVCNVDNKTKIGHEFLSKSEEEKLDSKTIHNFVHSPETAKIGLSPDISDFCPEGNFLSC